MHCTRQKKKRAQSTILFFCVFLLCSDDAHSVLGASVAAQLGFDVQDLNRRLENLEQTIYVDNGRMPDAVLDMKRQVETFRQKLEV